MERTEGTEHTVDAAPKDKWVDSRKCFLLSFLHSSAVTPVGAELGCTALTAGSKSSGILWGGVDGTAAYKGVWWTNQVFDFWSCLTYIIFNLSLFSKIQIKQKIGKTCKCIKGGWHRYSCLNERSLVPGCSWCIPETKLDFSKKYMHCRSLFRFLQFIGCQNVLCCK